MARKESVLSQEEKDSFEIEKFIFHIIIQEEINPLYLDAIELTPQQVNFFKERFIDVSEGIQHLFQDKKNSGFYDDCLSILADPDKNFIEVSKKITASFKGHHNKNTNDGVFITSLVKVEGTRYLIFFLKLDHRKVYEYTVEKKKALLHEITKTFVEDKKAIQKSALVDVSDHYGWDVLATDRTATGRTALRKFFSDFLSVIEKETPSKLTEKAAGSVRLWAIANKPALDPKQEISAYKKRAIDYLSSTARFKTKDFINAVIQDENDARKEKLLKSFKDYCDEIGLSGQSFVPNKNSIDRKTRRNIRRTAEGVKIEWEGDAIENNIDIPPKANKNDGLFHIVIKTSRIDVVD